jgi:hypothetical protein
MLADLHIATHKIHTSLSERIVLSMTYCVVVLNVSDGRSIVVRTQIVSIML